MWIGIKFLAKNLQETSKSRQKGCEPKLSFRVDILWVTTRPLSAVLSRYNVYAAHASSRPIIYAFLLARTKEKISAHLQPQQFFPCVFSPYSYISDIELRHLYRCKTTTKSTPNNIHEKFAVEMIRRPGEVAPDSVSSEFSQTLKPLPIISWGLLAMYHLGVSTGMGLSISLFVWSCSR